MKKLILLIFLPLHLLAQNNSFQSFKNYPFTTELCASAHGSKIAWAMDEQGRRNVYVAEGPSFTPRKLTNFTKDDGQEISSLCISSDGKWVVFVRGGDHGGNWDLQSPVNSSFDVNPAKIQVASIPFAGGETKYLSEGDNPVISPGSSEVAFIKSGQAWSAPIDGTVAAKGLFTTHGTVGSLQWSPDGNSLLFISNRIDHSIIGIYTNASAVLRWVAPSFNRDVSPRWSADGNKIVFVRRPGAGGAPDSLLVKRHTPWSIYKADLATNTISLLWKAPETLRGSVPTTDGSTNLFWAANNTITFLSYHDGWPHLYAINANGGNAKLLTPGNYMAEHISLSDDKRFLTFSANTGNDPLDIERRHAVRLNIENGNLTVLTNGTGLEWTPVITGDGNTAAFISASAQRPPLPAVMKLKENSNMHFDVLCEDLVPTDFPANKLVTPRQVIFKSADGVTVHADLFEPPGGAAKKPAIVYVHGGPQRQMLLGWHYSDYYANAYACNQYLASLGFIVLAVNYRLGIGYGYEFHQPAHGGPTGASEYQDIKAAGEWLQRQDFVDVKKIGIYGGSYGGYLTAMALARDSRIFAAGVDIHGVHNWVAAASLTASANDYEKAPDYDKAVKTAWLSSPLSSIDGWKSPVLIIHADDDRNVRFNQSADLVNRLEKKKIPYESMVIVDDTHHWMNFNNSVSVYAAVVDFFVRKFK